MVTPGAPVRLHRIRNDQLYHYYLGDPLEVFLLRADGSHQRVVVGPNIRAGERVQLLIPGNTFHTARLAGRRRWFLGASTEWPGVVPMWRSGILTSLPRGIPILLAICAPSWRRSSRSRRHQVGRGRSPSLLALLLRRKNASCSLLRCRCSPAPTR